MPYRGDALGVLDTRYVNVSGDTMTGTLAMGANDIMLTGSLAATGARITKGWFIDVELTNMPTVGGTAIDSTFLKLDASNDPVTAGLEINAATLTEPVLILQTTDDDTTNNLQEWQQSDGTLGLMVNAVGNLEMPATTSAIGQILQNAGSFIHSYGTSNLFFGVGAGNFALTGQELVGLGGNALASVTTASYSVAIGSGALTTADTGGYNIAIGSLALEKNTSGWLNVALGRRALKENTTGVGNMALGQTTMNDNLTGSYNVAIGTDALRSNLASDGNIAIGAFSLNVCTGPDNTAIGYYSANKVTTGTENISIGTYTLRRNETGSHNITIGCWAGYGVASNSYSNNVLIGYKTGYVLTTGSNNILIGYQAGNVISTGASNIIIGYNIDPTGAAVSNELNIGALIYGDMNTKRGGVNVVPTSLAAAWHIDQATVDAAIPVLYLDQADVSEEMIEFVSTIGVGNAIEAVGGKTLTTTHFIKVVLPGGLTRYIPVGTIA